MPHCLPFPIGAMSVDFCFASTHSIMCAHGAIGWGIGAAPCGAAILESCSLACIHLNLYPMRLASMHQGCWRQIIFFGPHDCSLFIFMHAARGVPTSSQALAWQGPCWGPHACQATSPRTVFLIAFDIEPFAWLG